MKKQTVPPLQRFSTSAGRTIYALSFEVFPSFYGNVYVVSDGERRLLVDCGSGMESSNRALEQGLESIEETYGEPILLSELDAILVTHAHMDHFGGLAFLRERTDAPIAIHALDRRVVSHYEERLVVASRSLRLFLLSAGISPERCDRLMTMYGFGKHHYHSIETELELREGAAPEGRGGKLQLEVLHVPGHCPGQVCLRFDDVLLSADHVLSRITPHQSPESITLNMGLGHYLDSLQKVQRLEGIRLALGGHELPIHDLGTRVEEIRRSHDDRLAQVLEFCRDEPRSTADVSRHLFGKIGGYTILLALEETGAHVEYLHQRGELVVANVEEVERAPNPVLRYVRP